MAIAVASYQTVSNSSPFTMPRSISSFKGDQEAHVDQLIAASMINKQVLNDLQERALVPFFDGMTDASQFEPLQKRASRKTSSNQAIPNGHHGLKRTVNDRSNSQLADGTTGSPPKKENQVQKAKHCRKKPGNNNNATPSASKTKPNRNNIKNAATTAADHASGAHSDGELSARSHTLPPAATRKANPNGKPPRPAPSKSFAHLDPSVTRESLSAEGTPSKAATGAGFRGSKFAGPAFTNSPMPDTLPIPTTSLLMQEAADKLRSSLML